eukprot:jgi/Chlat1/6781/Chrsp50S06454
MSMSAAAVPSLLPAHGQGDALPKRRRWRQNKNRPNPQDRAKRKALVGIPPMFRASASSSPAEDAARWVVDGYIKDGSLVGVGGGGAGGGVFPALIFQHLGKKLQEGSLKNVTCVATSPLAAQAAAVSGVRLWPGGVDTLERKLDFFFDGADAVTDGTLHCIKGRASKSSNAESISADRAMVEQSERFVVVCSEEQHVNSLVGMVPIIVRRDGWEDTAEALDEVFLGVAAGIWRRPSRGRSGPSGGDFPYISSHGHFVLDVDFDRGVDRPDVVARAIEGVEGVVTHGLFVGEVHECIVVGSEGFVTKWPVMRDVQGFV